MENSTPSTPSTVSTPSAPSAPAESSSPVTSSTPDTSSGTPPSWEDALTAAGLTGGPAPDDTTDPQTAPVAAIAPPETPAVPPSVEMAATDPKGPIPFDRHSAILENARRKTAEEIVGRVEQQYGPAIQLQQRLQSDTLGTLTQLIDEAVSHPEIGQHVISQLARTLSARRQKTSEIAPIETEIGKVYTAEQVEALVERQMAQRFAPIEQERQERALEAQQMRQQQETRQTVAQNLKAYESRPGFVEHKTDIAARQKAYVAQGMNMWAALGAAYSDVLTEKVWPQQQAATTTKFVQSAVAKAQASTGNPAAVAPSTSRRPTTWEEALAQQGL